MSEVRYVDGKRVATPEYRSWQMMLNRCRNPRATDYRRYGARGIKVCDRWLKFENFLADMGRRPADAYTLERSDSNGNYEPKNCRWATRLDQARNRTYCKTKSWILAERLGVKKSTANHVIWQVRQKDKGNTKWFSMSPELEATVRAFLQETQDDA